MKARNFLLTLVVICFLSCGSKSSGYTDTVALDPTWYTLGIPGRETALTAFSTELIETISSIEKLKVGVYQRSWDSLVYGLQSNEYIAICTNMESYLFYEKLYIFSDIYLATGPVIVTKVQSHWSSLEKLSGREVGILRGSPNALLLEKYPNVIQRTYGSVQQALQDITNGVIDAMILDILTAEAFVSDLYAGQLKISSAPLTPEGLRLMGLRGKSEQFIQQFNQGLARAKSKEIYKKLSQKWGLAEPLTVK